MRLGAWRRSRGRGRGLTLAILGMLLASACAGPRQASRSTSAPGAGPSPPTPAPTAEPPAALYWGVYMDGVPFHMEKLDSFEQLVNKRVSVVHWGQPWRNQKQAQKFPAFYLDQVRARGAIPLLNWGSWDLCCGEEQDAFQLAKIARGDFDSYIRQWATDAKNWPHPFFLRFDHEMNGWWQFPWSEQLNGNRRGDYLRAWRHVHDLFTQVGATNVTWVWSPNVIIPGTTPLASLYPGDQYVDWVAMDGYNWGTDQGNTWASFAQVFGPTYQELIKLAPGKPIMLAEMASSEQGGSKAAWVRDALQSQLPNNFPAIKALIWFNWDDGQPELSWPIDSSPAALAAFRAAIASDGYASNRYAQLATSPIPAPPAKGTGTP